MVYIAAAVFFLSVFPLHIHNYMYYNESEKYASINVCFYRFIRIFNMNTVKDKPGEMQINGKNKKMSLGGLRSQAYNLFNQLCIYKIIQVNDFGLKKESNAYFALTHNALTVSLYKFIQMNGNYCKLRNYTVLNEEHDQTRMYWKMVTIVNLTVITKLFLIFLWGKINELKTEKKQG